MEQDVSTISAGSLVFILCMGFLLLVLPRRYAIVPLLVSGCYMTLGQALVIGGLHFYLIRILIFFGMIRILVKKEVSSIKLTSIDKVLVAWLLVSTLLYPLFGGFNLAFGERLGRVYNTFGIYLFFRACIRDLHDIVFTVKLFGIIIIPLAVLFAVEQTTGRNPFSIFGGVPLFPEIRNDRLRCQGPFMHSILAGTFGATSLPFFAGLWAQTDGKRFLASGAILASTVIVFTSAASGPLLAFMAILVGLVFWHFRSHMRLIRWGIAILLLALHAYMKAPVWFLISQLSDITGGGGWYRSALIDAAVNHFSEWWLIGTGYTAHWMPTGLAIDPNMCDMVNYFIAQGVQGGLLALILFIWLIVKCFKTVGVSVRNGTQFSVQQRFMIWCLGCAVFGHVTSFFSVSYFDQITIFWYMVIAMIVAIEGTKKVIAITPAIRSAKI